MNIRFINLTTSLPVDKKIEQEFKKMIDPAYRKAVGNRESDRGDRHVDIFFVDEYDPDLRDPLRKPSDDDDETDEVRREMKIDPDWLGVYFGFHPEFNRSIIKVCPERVMGCALAFTGGGTLPLIRRYPVLLVAVVIHELAHWLMDGDSKSSMDVYPWEWLIECRLEEDPTHPYSRRHRHFRDSRTISPSLGLLRHFIEESLAEAFILKQRLTGDELDYLLAFTNTSPPGYRQGVLWSGSLAETITTALSWARFKSDLHHPRWEFVHAAGNTPLDALVAHLQNGSSVDVFEFESEFIDHLATQASTWQVAYQAARSTWDDRLNGVFGVYWHLADSRHLSAPDRLKFIEQWAANGSPGAIDKLHETRGKNAESLGDFKKALEHQEERLRHLPMLGHNDYWHKRHLDEINAVISALQSRMAM